MSRLWIVYGELNADTADGPRIDVTQPPKNHLSKAVRQDFLRLVRQEAARIATVARTTRG